MAKPAIDISLVGSDILIKQLASFEPKVQKRVVRQTLRKSAKHLKAHIVTNLSGHPVSPDSGRYLAAMTAAKPKALPRSRTMIGVGIAMPYRAELGIDPGYKWYYPFAVEYGHDRAPPKAPLRRAIDDHADEEHRFMGRDIGKGVDREARKHFKNVRGPK